MRLAAADPLAVAEPAASLVTTEERAPELCCETCPNWRRGLRIELPDGTRVPVRCKSPNRCPWCGYLTAIENATVLRLDAELGRHPTFGITLTTHRPLTDVELYEASRLFWRHFRQRWGHVDYCGFVEWTTGKAARSGGIRRTHVHYLVKGLPIDVDADEVAAWTSAEWKKLAGAWRVDARPLRTPAGSIAYLALHHQKAEQGPPVGWSGKRFRPSRGYFDRPIANLRAQARLELAKSRTARAGRDVDLVEPATVMEWMRGRVVYHAEPDGRAHELGPGTGLSDAELDVLLLGTADARAQEDELDRYARLLAETRRELAVRARQDARA